MTPTDILPADLQLGDRVRAFDGDYDTATVVRIDDVLVYLFRPFVHVPGVVYASSDAVSVFPYIGTETFPLYRDSNRPVRLLHRETALS